MSEQEGGIPPIQVEEGAENGLHAPTAYRLIPEKGGDSPVRKPAPSAHGMPEREEGTPLR